MTPEQEAELRAKMAAVRDEADVTAGTTTIDLDEPEPTPAWDWENPTLPGRALGLRPSGPQLLSPEQQKALDDRRSASAASWNAFADAGAHYARPFVGLAPGGPLNNLAMGYAERKVRGLDQDEKVADLTEQEATLKKAMERAKQIAAVKAQQEKVEKDRDESLSSGRGGYHVERALYPSDLHRR